MLRDYFRARLKTSAVWRYGLAVLSVIAAVLLISLMDTRPCAAPHVSLLLCAVLFTTWFCGVRPGLLAVALSVPAFDYFFVPPINSLALEAGQLPRFGIFLIATFFVWSVGATARRSTGALVRARDELQRNNEELREREELLRVLTENANDFIRLHTSEGRSVYASPSVERLYGRRPTFLFEFIHPEDLEAGRRWWEQVVAGGGGRLQWRVRDSSGNWRWLESSASRLQFKGQPHVLTVCRDITESKLAEERLRQTERELRLVIDTIPANAWRALPDGGVDFTNQRLLEELGFSHQDLAGWSWTNVVHPEDVTGFVDKWRASLASGEPMEIEARVRHADGEYHWYLIRNVPLSDDAGNAVHWYGTGINITERKLAEEALRKSENLWRTIFDDAAIGIAIVNPEGRPVETNPAFQKILGYTKEELRHLWFVDFTHPDDTIKEFPLHQEMIDGKRDHYQMEKRYIRKDGQVRWVNLIASVIPAEQPGEAFGVGMVEDITERKRAEEALRESQQLLQLVLATLPVGVVVIDRAGDIILVNAASKRIWGDIIISGRQRWAQTKGVWHDSGERIAPTAWASARALSEGQTSLNELIDIETYDGRQKTIENSAAPIRNAEGQIVGAVIVNEDVTERVRAEEALRETHSKLELLLNTSPLPITSVDASGRITSWNKAAERLFGWSAEEAVERVCPTILPEETEEYLELIRRVMRGETYVGLVLYRQKRDGGLLYCSVSVAPQRNGRGEPVGATLIVEDITERKRAEERLKRYNEELRALSARLHSAREEESARIAREIHDELGALLSSLKWDLEEVGEDIAGATGTPPLAVMREKVGALITLTDNAVNTVRRIASELRPTALEEFGLAEAVRWHAQQFQARTGIEVRCDCPQDGAGLNRELATAVFRIVQEALTNVLRHAQATRVDIGMNKEAGHLVLTISDNGRGITEAEKLASRSLGLLGMRERVNLLGGDITIEGTEGRGTVVTVRVPASD